MKSKMLFITAMTVFAALAAPARLSAQHTRYKLIDIGTFGGPASYLTDPGAGPGELVLNNAGMLTGKANTTAPDPSCALNCFLFHGFRWDSGTLTDLGTLPGGNVSDIATINARGWISGNSTTGSIDPVTGGLINHAVLWKNDQITDLGTLGGLESLTTYVNDGGEVVGFSSINSNPDPLSFLGGPIHPFIWQNGVMRDLGTLGGPDALPGPGCNNQRNNLVTGFSFINSTPNPDTGIPTAHPFLWDNGKMIDLGTLGGTLVCGPLDCLSCANNQGQVAGASTLAGNSVQHAFLWDHGVMTDLGTLGGDTSFINWINDAGEIVGTADLPGSQVHHAFLWRNGLMADLGTLGSNSHAEAINAQGQVVGRSLVNDTTVHAFLWENGGPMLDLNTLIPAISGLELYEAENINDRGEIAGRGFPVGCNDINACGHVFLLIPCDPTSGQDCSAVTATPSRTALLNNQSTTPTQCRLTPMQGLAAWRARLAQQYHIPGIVGSPRD
jgi:probable HAF family extracellular repeat protein